MRRLAQRYMQIRGSITLAGRKRMIILILGHKQRHVAVAASSYQFYERARRTTRFYFPRFRDIAFVYARPVNTYGRVPFMHASRVDLERFMPWREMQRDFKFAAVSCQNNDIRDNIGRVSINSGSAIRPDFTLLNI